MAVAHIAEVYLFFNELHGVVEGSNEYFQNDFCVCSTYSKINNAY